MPNILSTHFPTSHAFIIGINRYDAHSHLRNAVPDAEGIAQVLREEIHDYAVHPPLLDATYEEMIYLLEVIIPSLVKKDDRLLFYFAGHGLAMDSEQEGIPEGYILPKDAQLRDNSRSISMSRLRKSLEILPCRHVLLVLDCCFSGAFRWSSIEKRGLALRTIPKKIYQERFDRYVVDPAWQVLTSSAYDQTAADGIYHHQVGNRNRSNTGHSPFAQHLMDALRGEADVIPRDQPDGLITATEIYMYIRDKLEAETIAISERSRQTPGFFSLSKHDKGEYIFLSPKVVLNLPHYDPNLNPYKGLQSYEITDKDHFFGRDKVTEELYTFVAKRRFAIVPGASGSGKSSLVKAGLIPRLLEEAYVPLVMRPSEKPMEHLRLLIPGLKPHPEYKTLLLIDQFEELITQCHDVTERKSFLESLHDLINQGNNHFKLLLTIRSDFEPQFEDSPLGKYWREARFVVPPFSTSELEEVIERPAVERIILFDPPELVSQIVQEVYNEPGALPLLSFTMSEMYEKLKERGAFGAFRLADYQSLGGVIGSLRTRADKLYNQLPLDHQLTMQKLMLRMVSQEGGELAKRRVLLTELEYQHEAENKRVKFVLDRLTEARLIVQNQDFKGQPYAEPAHDALVRAWGTLWGWITAIGKDKLLLLNKLQEATVDYQSTQNQKDLWYNNSRLDAVLEEKELWLNAREIAFVEKSVGIKRRNLNRLITLLAGGITGLTILVIFAFWQSKIANNNAKQARLEACVNGNAALALKIVQKDPTLSLQIAKYAYEQFPGNPISAAAINEILSNPNYNVFYKTDFIGHESLVEAVSISKNGQYILTGALDQKAILWDLKGNPIQYFKGHSGRILTVAFSPNDKYVLTGSSDGTARLWDLSGNLIQVFALKDEEINTVVFSNNGKYILTGSSSGMIDLWDLEGNLIHTYTGHERAVVKVAFSPNDKYITSGSNDGTARLWGLSGNLIQTLFVSEYGERVNTLAISSNGQYIVTGHADKMLRLWDAQKGKHICTYFGHTAAITSVDFSSDGQYILSGSIDKTAKLWDISGKQIRSFPGHLATINAVVISNNNKYVVTGSDDGTAKLWELNGFQLDSIPFSPHGYAIDGLGYSRDGSRINDVAFSPDDQHFLAGISDGTVELLSSHRLIQSFRAHNKAIQSVAFSPNGRCFLTGSLDKSAKLWDLNKHQIRLFEGHIGGVYSVAFSPNGQYILTGSEDGIIKLWDLEGKNILTFPGHKDIIRAAAFSPDGQKILTGSWDKSAKLWDLEGNQICSLNGHNQFIYTVAFSPDGRKIITGSADRTIRLWDLKGRNVQTFSGHTGGVNAVAFSPDGQFIVSGSTDKTVRLWDLSGNQLVSFSASKGAVEAVTFSSDGKYILSGSTDKTVRKFFNPDYFLHHKIATKDLSRLLEEGLLVNEDQNFK